MRAFMMKCDLYDHQCSEGVEFKTSGPLIRQSPVLVESRQVADVQEHRYHSVSDKQPSAKCGNPTTGALLPRAA
jgi:hypothetical protein